MMYCFKHSVKKFQKIYCTKNKYCSLTIFNKYTRAAASIKCDCILLLLIGILFVLICVHVIL